MSKNLDRKLVKQLTDKSPSEFIEVKELTASSQDLNEVKSLSFLPALTRLDLQKNKLNDVGAIPTCNTLRWLNVSHNNLKDISGLSSLHKLQVLNVGFNSLTGDLNLTGLQRLGALIANDNKINSITSLGEGLALNTLVLKNNAISSLGDCLSKCPALAKLSVAHNHISDLGNSLENCTQLAELRISHNEIRELPESLSRNSRVRLIDLGSNPIERWKHIKVLQKIQRLQNLTLKGCPFAESSKYLSTMDTMLPHLQILDTRRVESGQKRRHEPSDTLFQDKAKKQKIEATEGTEQKKSSQKFEKNSKIANTSNLQQTLLEQKSPDLQQLRDEANNEAQLFDSNSEVPINNALERSHMKKRRIEERKKSKEIEGGDVLPPQLKSIHKETDKVVSAEKSQEKASELGISPYLRNNLGGSEANIKGNPEGSFTETLEPVKKSKQKKVLKSATAQASIQKLLQVVPDDNNLEVANGKKPKRNKIAPGSLNIDFEAQEVTKQNQRSKPAKNVDNSEKKAKKEKSKKNGKDSELRGKNVAEVLVSQGLAFEDGNKSLAPGWD